MCGILAVVNLKNKKIDGEKIISAWKKIEHRGRDLFKLWIDGEEQVVKRIEDAEIPENFKVLIAQNTLSIVGSPSLPREHNNTVLACNGEIYNYRELYTGFERSDVEVLFHRGRKELNGIYACIKYYRDKAILHAFRDYIGVNPLCYGFENGIVAIASELKAVREIVGSAKILNPRRELVVDVRKKAIYEKRAVDTISFSCRRFSWKIEELEKAICRATRIESEGLKKFYLLFSGGIDSSLLACMFLKHERKFTCITAGLEDSDDVYFAERVAEGLGLELKVYSISRDEVAEAYEEVKRIIDEDNKLKILISIPFYLALKNAKKHKVVFSGIGSEELFLGYTKYKAFKGERTLHRISVRGVKNLWINDLYRDNCVVSSYTKELRTPYLNKIVVNVATKLTPLLKIKNGVEKYCLRVIGEKYLGILAWRRKKASQYGSNVREALI